MAQFVNYAVALTSGHFVVITMPTAMISKDDWHALQSLDLPFVFTEDADAFAEDIIRIAEGIFTLPEGIFTVAEGTFRIIARRDMDISWLEMIVAELDTGIACHEITLMGCCMGM